MELERKRHSSPLRRVRKLLPGHCLIVDPQGVRTEQYWAYPEPVRGSERVSEISARPTNSTALLLLGFAVPELGRFR